ncbi:MAG: VOC family protein [Ilumatobacteraceae bacterium]
MKHRIEVAYLGIEVPDPHSLSPFFGDVIGLVAGEPTADGALTWRNDGKAQRLVVTAGPANDAAFVGFETIDDAAFDETVARLRAIGVEVADGDPARDATRGGCDGWRRRWPVGCAGRGGHRARRGHDTVHVRSHAERLPHRGHGIRPRRLRHHRVRRVVRLPDRRPRARDVGLARDGARTRARPGGALLHCNGRHHSVALARAPFELPQKLHHLMVEVNDRDDVGAAFDRAFATDLPIPNGLGTHDNDGMFSFYVSSPAGFAVEVGHGGRVVGDDWDDVRQYDRISKWGHQPLRQG